MKKLGHSGSASMYYFAAILLFVAAAADRSWIYAPIGVIFALLGFLAWKRQKKK